MLTVSLALSAFCLLMALTMAFLTTLADIRIPRLHLEPFTGEASLPSVSLIAPARNEERNLEEAVRSLMKIEYPRLQITLVNDRSTDSTGEILDRLAREFSQLNVVHLIELPGGWLGKNHAMQRGAECSTGDWLLFTDADVIFEPATLKHALAHVLRHQLDHLAATPRVLMHGWLLQAFVVTFIVNFLMYCRAWGIRNPRSGAHIGIGAFNLVRASVYRDVEGHRRVAMRPDDDVKLGKVIKRAGFRQGLVAGDRLISVEWYRTLGEVIVGLEKNSFAGTGYNLVAVIFASLLLTLICVWPFVAPLVVSGTPRWIYSCAAIVQLGMVTRLAVANRLNPLAAPGFPLCMLLFLLILWRSTWLTLTNRGIRWRDTFYSLKELRTNRV